ncbi:MAG: phosphoglucomutase/phosphomannomutase family protein [Bacteroidia bacterium]|nr:phosphoglucomutase/phosphomannomutase family protein [Bacteroidia bacterium]
MLYRSIKFGTDGWRAIIGKDYNCENLIRVSSAVAAYIKQKNLTPRVVLGHDCRFNGEIFAETVAKTLLEHDIEVIQAKGFVTTPMLSLGTRNYGASLGIILTASHNPPSWHGYKIKASFGGPLSPEEISVIEKMIPENPPFDTDTLSLQKFKESGKWKEADLEQDYFNLVHEKFDLAAIKNSGLRLAYDSMFGAGQKIMKRLFPEIHHLHSDHNPGFHGQAPEPIHKNLKEFSDFIRNNGNIDCGLVTDGDADRIGLYNGRGEFVDSHHIMLLLIHYLAKYKGLKGKVATAFSSTNKIAKICQHYGLPLDVVKIGFKYIAGIMVKEPVLMGGEESGGIAIMGHIPERDGIWMGLTLWEFMAKTGKNLDDLIKEIYEITGPFSFARNDVHLEESKKKEILKNCEQQKYTSFGKYKVIRMEDLDGFKFHFDENSWVMLRASGTEPLLRIYAEAENKEKVQDILNETAKEIF